MTPTVQIVTAFTFGVAFVVTLLVFAIKFPRPTPFQYTVFRIVLSLAAAGAAAMIPGFILLDIDSSTGILIRSGGALTVFVIVFFFNPAQLTIQKQATCDTNTIDQTATGNFLSGAVWNLLDENLQDAFALAATAAQREGKDYISTTVLFAAIRRLSPARLQEFFARLPAEALPDPIPEDIRPDKAAIPRIQSLSPCVQGSLASLSKHVTPEHKLASEDVLLDIARYGTGKSVRRLRTHGVDAERINDILKQLGWTVTERA